MLDEPVPLPELLEAHWPAEQVLALFADLSAGAEVLHVQLRTRSSDATVTLAAAQATFEQGEATAIQIRYRFQGESWSDTILPGEDLTKIIRTRLPTEFDV